MSKTLSLKLNDEVFQEIEEILRKSRRPRNAYINDAIRLYNKLWKRKLMRKALIQESALIAEDSKDVLEAFEELEDELVE